MQDDIRRQQEETGEWLNFFFREGNLRVPVRISRAALAANFGATEDGPSMVSVYVRNAEAIHRQVKARMRNGAVGTHERPLELRSADFAPPQAVQPVRPAASSSNDPVVRFHRA